MKYTPVCSVAFPISGIGQSNYVSLCKTMYCFLPLPITSPYPMLINGCFALDQSRRGIACTQDDSVKTEWNQALINDALVNAFLNLLSQITSYISNNSVLSSFNCSISYPTVGRVHFKLRYCSIVIQCSSLLGLDMPS